MIQIDLAAFASAISQTYKNYGDQAAEGYAKIWAERLHPMLEEAVCCWIEGKRVPDVSYQPEGSKVYSLERIMKLRGSSDILQAMLLLSDYINDPKRGEMRIMAPNRSRR